MRPAVQIVRQTWAEDTPGYPAILVDLLTRLGYRWYPQYTVYEDFLEFNQQQYRAKMIILDGSDRPITELHTFLGFGVTVEMAVHEAAYVAITHLRRQYPRLEDSGFRYFPYAPAGDDTRFYEAICTPYVSHRYDPQYLVRYVEAMDRTTRALTVELYETRLRLYAALRQLMPAVNAGIQPVSVLYPSRTEMPPGVDWPDVGGTTPARGPLLPQHDRLLHQSIHGPQDYALEWRAYHRHRQLPGYRGFPRR